LVNRDVPSVPSAVGSVSARLAALFPATNDVPKVLAALLKVRVLPDRIVVPFSDVRPV
jgi:hypothetical protein